MKFIQQYKDYLIAVIGSLLAGVFVYWVLSIFFITSKITIPISISVSTLIFGLTIYYNNLNAKLEETSDGNLIQRNQNQRDNIFVKFENKENNNISVLFLGTLFLLLILAAYQANYEDSQIFTNWGSFDIHSLIQLAAGIMLCFFIPGYLVINIISQKYKVSAIFAVLAGYLLSILITGIAAYISALFFDSAITQSKYLFISIYLIILASYLISSVQLKGNSDRSRFRSYFYQDSKLSLLRNLNKIKNRIPQLLVFGGLIGLIMTTTFVLFGGITIGDQWFHQGRALLFMSGSFREAAISQGETFYPPFQSALLAALSTISGTAIVNSYASIAFLNATPMFAFYYFFLKWNSNRQKAGLIACSLFTLSSGFGWIYLWSNLESFNIVSEDSSLDAIRTMGHLDIVSASNFVIPTAPDFSTGLIYIALPAGFLLLAFVQSRFPSTIINISLVVLISFIGIISHYEFYIFIIIASLLPVILGIKQRNYVYAGILISIAAVLLLNHTTPGDYYVSLRILGYPLVFLVAMFVSIMWCLSIASGYISKFLRSRANLSISQKSPRKDDGKHTSSFKFIAATSIIIVFTYLYLLSFLVLGELSLDTVRDHTSESNVPWYLYPMKLGVAGILGIAFILSILYKKFEKEVLVFAVIIGIAIITGPYYSEGRFSKYVMVGMVGFASLMIHRILVWRYRANAYRNVAIISTIVIGSGLSILLFAGYNSLILQTQDFINTLPRRHFPSLEELNLLEMFYKNIDVNSNKHNIVSLPNQYNRWEDGFMAKVPSFGGLAYDKVRQSPLALNSSTPDNLYRQLSFSDVRYILLPKNDINEATLPPIHFAIEHFKEVYQDKDYIVLEVPDLTPPVSSQTNDFGLVLNNKADSLFPANASGKRLQYNNTTFNLNNNDKIITQNKENQSQNVKLIGSHRPSAATVWSKDLDSRINAIETTFRITSAESDKGNNHVGLKWREGEMEYFLKLLSRGLELYEKPTGNEHYKLLVTNSEIEKRNLVWYKANIQSFDDSITVYIDDRQIIEVPKSNSNSLSITKLGLSSFHNDVEFKPIVVWNMSESAERIQKSKYFDYYYPLSILALAESKYDIFRQGDLSMFSNKVIVLADNQIDDNNMTNSYLDYVRTGGILVVLNSDKDFQRTLDKFEIHSNQSVDSPYTAITFTGNNNSTININGTVKGMKLELNPELNITSWYTNNKNEVISPFAIEKKLSKGKIVLLNTGSYFNTLSESPKQYFSSLSKISSIISISDYVTQSENSAIPMKGIIGSLEALGQISINSSSWTITEEMGSPYALTAEKIRIINESAKFPITFDNTSIKNLKLVGTYELLINSSGKARLPAMNSDRNYINLILPNNFDMKVRLHPQSSSKMEISTDINGSNHIQVKGSSLMEFHGLKTSSPSKDIALLVKEPKIRVHGNTTISNSILNGFLNSRGELNSGAELKVRGIFEASFAFIDDYHERSSKGIKIDYISYLHSVKINGSTYPKQQLLKLPGDISYASSTKNGQDIPLDKIINSTASFIILVVLIAIAVVIWLTRFRIGTMLKV